MERVNNVRTIKSSPKLNMSLDGDFFRCWVRVLETFHGLTKREMDILALFLKKRHELSKVISDTDTLDSVLMSETIKRQIREESGITVRHLRVVLSTFRKKGVIKDNKINIGLIPSVAKDGVGLLIYFDFMNEQQCIKLGPQASRKEA